MTPEELRTRLSCLCKASELMAYLHHDNADGLAGQRDRHIEAIIAEVERLREGLAEACKALARISRADCRPGHIDYDLRYRTKDQMAAYAAVAADAAERALHP